MSYSSHIPGGGPVEVLGEPRSHRDTEEVTEDSICAPREFPTSFSVPPCLYAPVISTASSRASARQRAPSRDLGRTGALPPRAVWLVRARSLRCAALCAAPVGMTGLGMVRRCREMRKSAISGTQYKIDALPPAAQRDGMARLARAVAPGVPHHVTQRGNRRQKVFFAILRVHNIYIHAAACPRQAIRSHSDASIKYCVPVILCSSSPRALLRVGRGSW